MPRKKNRKRKPAPQDRKRKPAPTKRKRKPAPTNGESVPPKPLLPDWLKSPTSLCVIGIIATILVGYLYYHPSAKSNKRTQLQLDGLFMEKHEEELKKKYPGGYMLLRIDSSKNISKNEFIPSRSNFMEEYELDWNKFRISKITESHVTLTLPWLRYKPQGSRIVGWTQSIPRLPIGKPYRFKVNWQTHKYTLYMELVEDTETVFAFAIGFKPE